MILSILLVVLRCEWKLSYFQEATVTMVITLITILLMHVHVNLQVVFLGFLFGSPVWGAVADTFGRKKVSGKYKCMHVHTHTHIHTHTHTHTHTHKHTYTIPFTCTDATGSTVVFGVVSTFSPGYYSLLVFRGLLGFGLEGGFLG